MVPVQVKPVLGGVAVVEDVRFEVVQRARGREARGWGGDGDGGCGCVCGGVVADVEEMEEGEEGAEAEQMHCQWGREICDVWLIS